MYEKVLSLMFVGSLVLGACGSDNDPTKDVAVDKVDVATETEKAEDVVNDPADEEGELYKFNEVIADNDNVYVEIIGVTKVYDDNSDDEAIVAVFDVENKTDRDLEVQSRSVSINDRMVDESLLELSRNIAAGKTAEVALSIYSYDGSVDIPDLENNFEMVLHFFDWDDMEFTEDVDVYVEF